MDALYQIPLFEGISEDEARWLLENSSEVVLERGDYYYRENEPVDSFYVMLEGELQITRVLNGTKTVMGTTPRGIIGGELALLNATPSPVEARAIVPSRLMVFNAEVFRRMFAECPTVGARILRIASERMAGIATITKQQEKMAALGKLSAGLAHELNNPAAAARRAAKTLLEGIPQLQAATMKLNSLNLSDRQLQSLISFQQDVIRAAADAMPLSPLEQSDREDQLGEWLEDQGINNGWEMASSFVTAGVTLDDLIALTEQIPPEGIVGMLTWLHSALYIADLLKEVEETTTRISSLVMAVKEYTYMDQAPLQELDVHKGLDSTLKMLNHKLKSLTVVREYDPDVPKITARGSELNQVWTNLIDNAIDALGNQENGTISLFTRCENNYVMVEISDNGSGIPPEVLPRIFEPYFTTKDVGVGTGLGLDISYRIIQQHGGQIEVQSKPGQTRFIVRLPINSESSD